MFVGDIGGKSILWRDFDIRKLSIYLPDLIKECLNAWSDVGTTNVASYDDAVSQTTWSNKLILIENKSCYRKHLAVHRNIKYRRFDI